MSYSIQPSENQEYIVLTIEGDFAGNDMMQYILEAHALGHELGTNRYLVDVTEARNTDSVLHNYEFAYSDMKKMEGVDLHAKVAALVSPGDHSHDFIEMVLCNAGLPIKLFTDHDEALEFLLKT